VGLHCAGRGLLPAKLCELASNWLLHFASERRETYAYAANCQVGQGKAPAKSGPGIERVAFSTAGLDTFIEDLLREKFAPTLHE